MKFSSSLFLLILVSVYFQDIHGQATNSPYSIFGIGQLENQATGSFESMGGTGIGLKSGNSLNKLNPASYSGIDSLSFLFEVGLYGKYSNLQSNSKTQSVFDGNISYIALGFRATKWWSISAGILPYSSMGYSIKTAENLDGTASDYTQSFSGSGKINQAYIGNSFSPIKNLSFGFHSNYVFGSFVQNETADLTSDYLSYGIEKTTHVQSINFDFGMQYFQKINNMKFGLGLTYTNQKKLKTNTESLFGYSTDTAEIKTIEKTNFIIPHQFGIGLSANYREKLTLAFDYTLCKWTESDISQRLLTIRDSERYSFGMEYYPGFDTRKSYGLSKFHYRLGAAYTKTYMIIDGVPIDSKSISLGLGIPLERKLTMINCSVEAGILGTVSNNLIREKYIRFNVNLNMHDIWFQKPKYD